MAGRFAEMVIVDGRPAVRGECDLLVAEALEQWLSTFDGQPLEIDLRDVEFFDAAALRVLLKVRERNPRVRIVHPSRPVRRLLELTGTDRLFDGQDHRERA